MPQQTVQTPYSALVDTRRNIAREWRQWLLEVTGLKTQITGGTIDGTVIGGTTPAAGTFTSLSATAFAKVSAGNTSGQPIPNNAATVVTNWAPTFDVNGNFNAAAGTFTAPTNGFYLVSASLIWATAIPIASFVQVRLHVNGALVAFIGNAGENQAAVNSQTVYKPLNLTAGQTVQVQAFQNSGAPVNLGTFAQGNLFSVMQVA